MPNTNASFSPFNRMYRLEQQLKKLDELAHEHMSLEAVTEFDAETEQLLIDLYDSGAEQLESYKYATLGEAEAIVNLPESAQQPLVRDRLIKSMQQRRQVLQGCIADLREAEAKEAEVLTGEDHEDPPGLN